MATSATNSNIGMLVESQQTDYGSLTEETNTKSLEDVYSIIGVGKVQYMYWIILAVMCYFDSAELVVISTIVPILRCEWELDVLWETLINVSGYFFSAVGGGVFAKLPDIYGRKKMITISLVLLFLSSSGSAMVQTKSQFLALRCVSGLCMGITFPTCITFSSEIVKSSHREMGPMFIVLFTNLSVFLSAVLAYLILNPLGWRWFIFLNALPLVICVILLLCLLPESPRYLMVSGKRDQATEAVQRMAKLNDITLPEHLNITVQLDQEQGSISDILKPNFRKETILMSVMYFGNLLLLFGTIVFVPLALYSGFCGGQSVPPAHECAEIQQESLLELSIVTFGCVLAAGVGYIAALKAGRSLSLKVFSTASFLVTLFFFKCFSNIATVVLFFLIKFLQTSHNMITLIIIPELYPTVFRNTAMSFINSWGKLGGVIGTGTVYVLYYYSPLLVVAMFCGSALLVAICSWIWSKETKKAVILDVTQFNDVLSQYDE